MAKLKSIKTGGIWQLGDHTLGCGSATDAAFVEEVVKKAGHRGN